MAQLLVRNLDDEVKARLRRRAERHGRSMEAEARAILRAAADQDAETAPSTGLGTRIAARFAGLGLTEDLSELPAQTALPAGFDPP